MRGNVVHAPSVSSDSAACLSRPEEAETTSDLQSVTASEPASEVTPRCCSPADSEGYGGPVHPLPPSLVALYQMSRRPGAVRMRPTNKLITSGGSPFCYVKPLTAQTTAWEEVAKSIQPSIFTSDMIKLFPLFAQKMSHIPNEIKAIGPSDTPCSLPPLILPCIELGFASRRKHDLVVANSARCPFCYADNHGDWRALVLHLVAGWSGVGTDPESLHVGVPATLLNGVLLYWARPALIPYYLYAVLHLMFFSPPTSPMFVKLPIAPCTMGELLNTFEKSWYAAQLYLLRYSPEEVSFSNAPMVFPTWRDVLVSKGLMSAGAALRRRPPPAIAHKEAIKTFTSKVVEATEANRGCGGR